jgi:hypothetical protein
MKHNVIITVFCLIFLAIISLSPAGAMQTCKDSVIATASQKTFNTHKNGIVSDDTTGLMWMQCSLGQKWEGNSCGGTAGSFSWADGLQAATAQQFAGYADWRLPNKNELESIVKSSCASPSINATVFPATPSAYFWSSTPYAAVSHAAWSVDFGFGLVVASVKSGNIHVRLVRDGL